MKKHKPIVHSYRTRVNEITQPLPYRICGRARKGTCVVGNVAQPKDQFNRNPSCADGYCTTCRSCQRADSAKSNAKKKAEGDWLKQMWI